MQSCLDTRRTGYIILGYGVMVKATYWAGVMNYAWTAGDTEWLTEYGWYDHNLQLYIPVLLLIPFSHSSILTLKTSWD